MRTCSIFRSMLFSRCVPLHQNAEPATEKLYTAANFAKLQSELKELTAAVEAAKTQSLYSVAEADNARKETLSAVEEMKRSAKAEFAKDMLNAADALEKTAKNAQQCCDENPSLTPKLRGILDGVHLSHQMINKVLKKHGVEKINIAVGAKFDPETAVSIFACPATESVPENHVAEVVKDGYTCQGKIIRHAHVGIGESL